jgi:hypothetical protein
MQIASTLQQKAPTTNEDALANTSIYGGSEPLELAILAQAIYKINPS